MQEEIRNFQANPQQARCNSTLLQSLVLNVSSADALILKELNNVLCQSTNTDVLNVLNASALLNQVCIMPKISYRRVSEIYLFHFFQTRLQVEQLLGQPLHIDDWAALVRLLATIISDIGKLDSLYSVSQYYFSCEEY